MAQCLREKSLRGQDLPLGTFLVLLAPLNHGKNDEKWHLHQENDGLMG